jgi:uncharacterized protein (DUF924 family)
MAQNMSSPTELARAVIQFWCEELTPEQHWKKDPAMDRLIAERFGKVREEVLRTRAAGWRDSVETLTGAVILLDQFSRNMFRGSARAFEGDELALELAKEALDRGWTHQAPQMWRYFLIMPLQHSENLADQERSLAEFRLLGDKEGTQYALKHLDQIKRFGRFPGRNQALGRVSTPEEREVIERGQTF